MKYEPNAKQMSFKQFFNTEAVVRREGGKLFSSLGCTVPHRFQTGVRDNKKNFICRHENRSGVDQGCRREPRLVRV